MSRVSPRSTSANNGGKLNPVATASREKLVSNPQVSVVMPVFNGATTLDRAIRSLARQRFPSWELLAVDDGSADGSHERLLSWAEQDRRIRVLRIPVNRGPAAARNEGLRHATAPLVTYLDCDDEYYPDYLEQVADLGDRADVLVSGYDLVRDDSGPAAPITAWDPMPCRDQLFARNIVTPLGVAHRRGLWAMVGGFDESLRYEEDWDFWKRLARAGAGFTCLPLKSGIYHVREGSLSRIRPGAGPEPVPVM